jgi:hypothetical protein
MQIDLPENGSDIHELLRLLIAAICFVRTIVTWIRALVNPVSGCLSCHLPGEAQLRFHLDQHPQVIEKGQPDALQYLALRLRELFPTARTRERVHSITAFLRGRPLARRSRHHYSPVKIQESCLGAPGTSAFLRSIIERRALEGQRAQSPAEIIA